MSPGWFVLKNFLLEMTKSSNGGMDCSVLEVGCVQLGTWRVSKNDGVDSNKSEILTLV